MRRFVGLVLLNLVAIACFLLVGWRTGNLTHIDSVVFSTPDAKTYREVADWIFGHSTNPQGSIWRPFLYPLFLGLADRAGGVYGAWLLNVVCWFAALNIMALAAYRLFKSYWVAAIAFLALATNISLIILNFHALTEMMVMALLALWIYGLSHLTPRPTPSQVIWALLPLTLLVVVKPVFEIVMVVMAAYLVYAVARGRTRALATVALGVCLIPIAAQVAVMGIFNGYWGLSEVGDQTIRTYYIARLDAYLAHSPDIQAFRAQAAALSNVGVVELLLNHPVEATKVFVVTLKENLLIGSNFVGPSNPLIARAILATNYVYTILMVAMIPLVGLALWRVRDARLAFLCIAVLNIAISAGISYWQGDRRMVIALPLWLIALVLAIKEGAGGERWGVTEAQPPRATVTATPRGLETAPPAPGDRSRRRA